MLLLIDKSIEHVEEDFGQLIISMSNETGNLLR